MDEAYKPGGMYHTCRYCRDFKDGRCLNSVFEQDRMYFAPFYEDGALSEAIKEGIGEPKFKQLAAALYTSKLSAKTVEAIMKEFYEELEYVIVDMTIKIDDKVSAALESFDFGLDEGIQLNDHYEFFCKNFN
jgi:hypothetical protein